MTNFTKIRLGALGLLLCLMSSCSNSNFSQLQRSNELTIVAAEEPVKIEKIEVAEPIPAISYESATAKFENKPASVKVYNDSKPEKRVDNLKIAKKMAVSGVKIATAPVTIAKKVTTSLQKDKSATIEGNLRMAIIFAFVAVIFYVLARFGGWVFDLIGTIFLIVALLFFLFWILDYA